MNNGVREPKVSIDEQQLVIQIQQLVASFSLLLADLFWIGILLKKGITTSTLAIFYQFVIVFKILFGKKL